MRRLTSLFPPEFLEEHAEELGVFERDRKFQIPAFVRAFVFGLAAGEGRTLADFRRCYNSTADRTLSPGGFYQRLTPTLAEYFSDLVETALDEVAVSDTAGVSVERFRDVMITDGTILRLHEMLSEEYKARHEEQAGAGVICERVDLSGSVYAAMKSSSRGLLLKHLTETELDREIKHAQKADETRLVRGLCFVKNLYQGDTRIQRSTKTAINCDLSTESTRGKL